MRQYMYFETDGLQVLTRLLKLQPGMGHSTILNYLKSGQVVHIKDSLGGSKGILLVNSC